MSLRITNSIISNNGIGLKLDGKGNVEIDNTVMENNGIAIEQSDTELITIKTNKGQFTLPITASFSQESLLGLAKIISDSEKSGDDTQDKAMQSSLWKEWIAVGANAATIISTLAGAVM